MKGRYESMVENLMNKGGGKFDMGTVSQILDSAEGKNLMRQLSGDGGDALKQAAAAAADGDSGAAGRMLTTLLSSKEGQALAKQVAEITNKNKK